MPESESSSPYSLPVPKILLMLPTSSMSSLPWRLIHKFMFWLTTWSFLVFIPLDSLSSRGIDLNFLFFFVPCITCSLSSLSDCDECSELALLSSNCLPFLSLFSLALALEGLFFCYFTRYIFKLVQRSVRKNLKAII